MLVDRFHSKAELILAICVASCAVLNAIVPYSKWIELLFVLFLVEGWIEVIVNVGKFDDQGITAIKNCVVLNNYAFQL